MPHVYAPCSLCGGEVRSKSTRHTYDWDGELSVFENVPAGVCVQCGEAYFTAETVRTMERLVRAKAEPTRVLQVPVYPFAKATTA